MTEHTMQILFTRRTPYGCESDEITPVLFERELTKEELEDLRKITAKTASETCLDTTDSISEIMDDIIQTTLTVFREKHHVNYQYNYIQPISITI